MWMAANIFPAKALAHAIKMFTTAFLAREMGGITFSSSLCFGTINLFSYSISTCPADYSKGLYINSILKNTYIYIYICITVVDSM